MRDTTQLPGAAARLRTESRAPGLARRPAAGRPFSGGVLVERSSVLMRFPSLGCYDWRYTGYGARNLGRGVAPLRYLKGVTQVCYEMAQSALERRSAIC